MLIVFSFPAPVFYTHPAAWSWCCLHSSLRPPRSLLYSTFITSIFLPSKTLLLLNVTTILLSGSAAVLQEPLTGSHTSILKQLHIRSAGNQPRRDGDSKHATISRNRPEASDSLYAYISPWGTCTNIASLSEEGDFPATEEDWLFQTARLRFCALLLCLCCLFPLRVAQTDIYPLLQRDEGFNPGFHATFSSFS